MGHFLKIQSYIDLESPINVMSRQHYNGIMNKGLESRQKQSNPSKSSNFVGRVGEVTITFEKDDEKMFDNDWGLESKEVSPLGEELSLFDRPNEVERGRIQEARRLELFFNNKFLNVWLLLTTMVIFDEMKLGSS
ncbi:hypothetical protein Tco_0896897 [Tanacetum coccineum]